MALSNRENNNFREQLLINDAEGKLTQSIFPEFVKIRQNKLAIDEELRRSSPEHQ